MAAELGMLAAFVAGILSFASPCVLPIIPGFLTYLGSVGLKAGEQAGRLRIFANAASYVLGFTLVFSILGVLLNGVLGSAGYDVQLWLSRIGGALIIAFGLYTLGLLKLEFLEREYKLKAAGGMKNSYAVSFLFGASFAVGWTPCVGAILGAILTLAATAPGQSFLLLFSYSLGLGLPFLLAGAFIAQARAAIAFMRPYMGYINAVAGMLLIILGILVFTNTLSRYADFGLASAAFGG